MPNAISALRIALVPVWVLLAERARPSAHDLEHPGAAADLSQLAALAVLALIGLSDVVDGFLARRYGLATQFGATLDAVADKLTQVVLVTWLALRPGAHDDFRFAALPLWFLGLLIARDAVLLGGSLALRRARGRVVVVHRYHGRLASVLLFALLLGVCAGLRGAGLQVWVAGCAAVTAVSTALYVRDGLAQLRGEPAPG